MGSIQVQVREDPAHAQSRLVVSLDRRRLASERSKHWRVKNSQGTPRGVISELLTGTRGQGEDWGYWCSRAGGSPFLPSCFRRRK